MSPKPKKFAALTATPKNDHLSVKCSKPPAQAAFDFYNLTEEQKKTLLALRRVMKRLFDAQASANPGLKRLQ
jgi:hypothetical protein